MEIPLSERIKRIEQTMGMDESSVDEPEEKKKKPGIRIPFFSRVGKAKSKKNWVSVMKILDNRNISFEKQHVENETIIVDGLPRIVTPDETLMYKGNPIVILPSWSVKPFSPTDNLSETESKQYSAKGHKLLLARMLGEIISTKKKVSLAIVFIIIVALIAGGYFLMKSGVLN